MSKLVLPNVMPMVFANTTLTVAIAILFSFNDGKSRSVWQGFSVRWWWGDPTQSVFHDPAYTSALDWELEIGFVLKEPLLDATSHDAERAIGAFVLINDFSARDVQIPEQNSGFGP